MLKIKIPVDFLVYPRHWSRCALVFHSSLTWPYYWRHHIIRKGPAIHLYQQDVTHTKRYSIHTVCAWSGTPRGFFLKSAFAGNKYSPKPWVISLRRPLVLDLVSIVRLSNLWRYYSLRSVHRYLIHLMVKISPVSSRVFLKSLKNRRKSSGWPFLNIAILYL